MNALISLSALGLLVLLVFGPIQKVITDIARQRMFEYRDQLFDLAADGKLEFESTEYRDLRRLLNRQIRFAHIVTLPRIVFVSRFGRELKKAVDQKENLSNAAKRVKNPDVRAEVEEIVQNSRNVGLGMIVAKSPLAILFLFFAIPLLLIGFLVLRSASKGVVNHVSNVAWREVERDAAHGKWNESVLA